MEKLLTIGIPVYNMEKYLHRCLKSVSSIKNRTDCEIIVVNDGSRDNSLKIAREYESLNPDLIHVIDKPNGGWGSAINLSINEAHGKYYKSLDSDDWFDTVCLDNFIDEIRDIDTDIILSPFNEVDEDGNITSYKNFGAKHFGQTLDLNEYIAGEGTFRKSIHAIAYRTQLLKDNNFHVWEKFYGDIDYINTPLTYAKTIHFSPYCIYQYMIGREGQSISVAGYRAHINDYLSMAKKLISIFGKKRPSNAVEKYLFEDSIKIAVFAHKLLMYPSLCGNTPDSKKLLKDFNYFLKIETPLLFNIVPSQISKFGISPISIWRITGINLYKILISD